MLPNSWPKCRLNTFNTCTYSNRKRSAKPSAVSKLLRNTCPTGDRTCVQHSCPIAVLSAGGICCFVFEVRRWTLLFLMIPTICCRHNRRCWANTSESTQTNTACSQQSFQSSLPAVGLTRAFLFPFLSFYPPPLLLLSSLFSLVSTFSLRYVPADRDLRYACDC